MTRKTRDIVITDENSRDNGKVFRIKEKSVYEAEFWAMRAFGGMIEAGVEIPQSDMSMQGLAQYGLGSIMKIKTPLLKELLDEMMDCVSIVPNPEKEPQLTRKLLPNDPYIQELTTLVKLRTEIFLLHVDFFINGGTKNTAI